MTSNTIDNDRTNPGSEGTLLAGRYRIIRQLGQGGMGSVWLAEDTQLDGKQFAIKMLPSILVSNKRAYAQLKSEALVAMKLVHPNIVQIRAFEENDGNPFLVMDYIDGQTLDDYLAEREMGIGNRESVARDGESGNRNRETGNGLPESDVIRILKPIAAALDYAHSQGVVHRDVKPSNIMIRKDGVPFVLDFGISREMQETMTRVTGKLSSGTLLYMSPEQLHGAPPKKGQDIYSFAAMAYECMSGHPPFCRGQIEFQIDNDMPEPLVGRVAPATAESVGRDDLIAPLVAGIMSGLAKKPEDRPSNCAGVLSGDVSTQSCRDAEGQRAGSSRAEHVERVEDGRARSPGALQGGKGRIGKALGILALLVALAGGAYYGWTKYDKGVKAREAELLRTNEERIAKLAAEKAAVEAEKHKIEEDRENREKELAEERARLEKTKNRSGQPVAVENLSLAEQEARKKEVARIAELRVDIEIKASDAREKMDRIAPYRGEPDGFQSHIANADTKWKVISGAERKPATVADAEVSFKLVSEAESAIAKELHWLKTNKTARDGAKALEAEIAHDIDPELNRFKADDYARATFAAGERLRKDGNEALASGDFPKASEKLQAAKAKLSEAASAAKKFCIDTHLNTARKWSSASKWQQCVEECNMVLGWDALNTEAKMLKVDAESHLVPTAAIIILVDDKPLSGEEVKIGGEVYKTPIRWRFDDGKDYGGVEVSFERNGKRYFGTLEKFKVDWRGPREFKVLMKEYTGPKHGDRKTLILPGGVPMEMIYVEPGSFIMGSPVSEEDRSDDEVQHRVTLTKGYWLGKYEVTQKQWQSVMGTNPSGFRFTGDDRPVENVSWDDCQEFTRRVNAAASRQLGGEARLPTEAEWEYACRANTKGEYALRVFESLTMNHPSAKAAFDNAVWHDGNSGFDTHPVGLKSANAWGFHDMHGNVCEWCRDWYGSYSGNATDPAGPASGFYRVLRGGSWNDKARFCRSAFRHGSSPGNRRNDYGFRLCCSAGPRE